MKICFQNSNQKTFYLEDANIYDTNNDKLCSKNLNFYPQFYDRILNNDPDIIVLAEVAKPNNIIYEFESRKPKEYGYLYNEKDLVFECSKTQHMISNKIMIIFKKSIFDVIGEPDESLYTKDGVYDFLHVCFLKKDNMKKYNVFGIRMCCKNELIRYNIMKTNDVAMEKFKELIDYTNQYDNVIMVGDFNNAGIFDMDEYKFYKYYNYQNMYNYVEKSSSLTLKTDGIYYERINDSVENFDDKSIYSYYIGKSKIDHAIVSKTLITDSFNIKYDMNEELSDFVISQCKAKGIRNYSFGVPDHYLVIINI